MILWFTGLSGAGKTTIARELASMIKAEILDGDILRNGINKDLGFSIDDRTENLRRAAYIAKIIEGTGKNVIATFITPLESQRKLIKNITGALICYIYCPLEVCRKRDPKGLYDKAAAGKIENFTGLTSPFEEPRESYITVDTQNSTPQQCAKQIFNRIFFL